MARKLDVKMDVPTLHESGLSRINAVFVTGAAHTGRHRLTRWMMESFFTGNGRGRIVDISMGQILRHVSTGNGKLSERVRVHMHDLSAGRNLPDDLVIESFNAWLTEELARNKHLEFLMVSGAPLTDSQFNLLKGFKATHVIHVEPDQTVWDRRTKAGCPRCEEYAAHTVPVIHRRKDHVLTVKQSEPKETTLVSLMNSFWGLKNSPIPRQALERTFEAFGQPIPA